MFGFLKKKLKEAISGFSKKVEEESKPEEIKEERKIEENKVEEKKAEDKINEEVKEEVKTEDSKKREKKEAVNEDKSKDKEIEESKKELEAEEREAEKKEEKQTEVGKKAEEGREEKQIRSEKELEEKTEKGEENLERKGEIKEKESRGINGGQDNKDENRKEIEEEKGKVEGEKKESRGFFSGIKKVFSHHKTEEVQEKKVQKYKLERAGESEKEKVVEEDNSPKSFAQKIKEVIVKKTLTEEEFDKLFWDVEVVLLQNNVALEVIEKIKSDLKKELVNKKVFRKGIPKVIEDTLRRSVEEILSFEKPDILNLIKSKKEKPFVILFLGINGSGKTTTVAKLANFLKKNGFSCVMAAGDTFRAAAIQQLEEHSKNLGIKIIKQDYGSDSAAVAYDAIQYAKAHNVDVVLIDTAGRLHSNKNLMEELKKIVRVTKPDMKIFVGESVTGNDCVEQAKAFNEQIGIDSIILTKADVDDKGGAALSITYVTKKPIIFIGTGQTYDDFKPFNSREIVKSLFAD